MPMMRLALDLPGAEVTALMREVVQEVLDELGDGTNQVYSDGYLPGTEPQPGPVRFAKYLEVTDPMDYENLFDDDYFSRMAAGLDAPPVSKYWLDQMAIRGSFDRNRKDFQRLLDLNNKARERFK